MTNIRGFNLSTGVQNVGKKAPCNAKTAKLFERVLRFQAVVA